MSGEGHTTDPLGVRQLPPTGQVSTSESPSHSRAGVTEAETRPLGGTGRAPPASPEEAMSQVAAALRTYVEHQQQ